MDLFGNKALAKQVAALQVQLAGQVSQTKLIELLNGMNLESLNADTYNYDNAFKTVGAVYEVIDLISNKVANSPIVMYRIKDKKKLDKAKRLFKTDPVAATILKAQAIEEVDDYAVSKLIDNPNPYMNRTQFIKTLAEHYLLRGNSYIYANKTGKKPQQLYPFPDMRIVTNQNYLDPIKGYTMFFGAQEIGFDITEIEHLKTSNPCAVDETYQYLYGISPLAAYLEPIRTIQEAQKQSSKMMRDGGAMQLISPKDKEDQLGNEQRRGLKEAILSAQRFKGDLARIVPSSVAVEVNQIGLSSADLELIEQKKVSQADVYRAFHVPLQYLSADSSTYNNVSTAVKQLIYDAVDPIADAIGYALTNQVGKVYGDIFITLDTTQLPEMAINMKEVADYVTPLYELGIINQDEARAPLKYGELGTPESQAYIYRKGKQTNNNNDTNQDIG